MNFLAAPLLCAIGTGLLGLEGSGTYELLAASKEKWAFIWAERLFV